MAKKDYVARHVHLTYPQDRAILAEAERRGLTYTEVLRYFLDDYLGHLQPPQSSISRPTDVPEAPPTATSIVSTQPAGASVVSELALISHEAEEMVGA